MNRPRRRLAGVALLAATVAAVWGPAVRTGESGSRPAAITVAREIPRTPFLMFRTLAPPAVHDRVAMVAVADLSGPRAVATISCSRLHFAAGLGICLVEESDGTETRHVADVFDRTFRRRHRIPLPGVPTRVRVAPGGRLAAVSTYAEEESPAGERLALESILIDLERGIVVADLREFAIDAADQPIGMPRDFASVAFDGDGDRFYATLSVPGGHHLVIGSVRERRLRTLGSGFANEGLSRDGRRLVIKRVDERGFWQLSILDLETMREQRLEHGARSIDDQVEWLDDRAVIFHDGAGSSTGIWRIDVDEDAGPRLLVADAYSPAAVHR